MPPGRPRSREPRDVRRSRDDPHAGGGVRAAGVRHRPHRAAVHRVCADAGRGGAGVRLRGADADAHDVLAAAAARGEARRGSTTRWSAFCDGHRPAATGARWLAMLAHGADGAGARVAVVAVWWPAVPAEVASSRRSRTAASSSGSCTAPDGATMRLHRSLRADRERCTRRCPRSPRRSCVVGPGRTVTHGTAVLRLKPLGGAHPQPEADHRRAAPKCRQHSRRARVRRSIRRRSGSRPRPAVEFVIQTPGPTRSSQRIDRPDDGRVRQYPGLAGRRDDLKLNKPQLTVDGGPRQGRRPRRRVDADRPHAGDAAGRAAGHAVQARGRAVRRDRAARGQERRPPTDITAIYVRARDGKIVQLSNLVACARLWRPSELNHFNRLRAVTITGQRWRRATRSAEALDFLEGRHREKAVAADGADRPRRAVARVPRVGQGAAASRSCWRCVHLSRAGGAVRELRRSVRDHAHGAAVDDRRTRSRCG